MSVRFGRPRGRFFSGKDEYDRIQRDVELHQEVYGSSVLWFFFTSAATVVDDVYDEGSVTGGKDYRGPVRMPVISVVPQQGAESADDQGLATYDRVVLRLAYRQAREAGLDVDLVANRERHLLDRFVWRSRVFDVTEIQTAGHFGPANVDTVLQVSATQLRPDELVDSPSFARYSG